MCILEVWDVYDENRNKTGRTVIRGEELQKGDYHLVVHIWIKNSKDEYLISKRTPNKQWPLMWECTGGSAIIGDDSLKAALREVQEELGVTLDPTKGTCISQGIRHDHFEDVWIFEEDVDIDSVVYQPEEVCDAKWADEKEIKRMISIGEFVSSFTFLDKVFSYTRKV